MSDVPASGLEEADRDRPVLRRDPDPDASTARPAPVAPELAELDRRLGRLAVNQFTYRPLRWLGRLARAQADTKQVSVRHEDIAGRRMILVEPEGERSGGALMLIHGGGYVIGDASDIVSKAAHFARTLGVSVFCPSYRLAPQAPFPAPLDDCHAAWQAIIGSAKNRRIDPARIAIGGYSAGAGLAACLAQQLRDEGGTAPVAQLLVYPMLDAETAARRELDAIRHRVWSNRNNRFGWASFLGHPPDLPAAAYAVAARCDNPGGLAPAWIGIGTCDLFLDEARAYARRLAAAGTETSYVEAPGAIHGFDMIGGPMADAFTASQVEFLQRHIGEAVRSAS